MKCNALIESVLLYLLKAKNAALICNWRHKCALGTKKKTKKELGFVASSRVFPIWQRGCQVCDVGIQSRWISILISAQQKVGGGVKGGVSSYITKTNVTIVIITINTKDNRWQVSKIYIWHCELLVAATSSVVPFFLNNIFYWRFLSANQALLIAQHFQ